MAHGHEAKLKITAEDAGFSKTFAKAEKIVEGFFDKATTKAHGFVGAGIASRLAIEKLEAEIVKLKALDAPTEAQEASLARLKVRYEEATEAAAKATDIQKGLEDQIRGNTVAIGQYGGQIRSLNDVLQISLPTLGKWALGFAAITTVAKQTYGGTRALIGGLKDLGIDVDEMVQRFPLLMEGFVEWDRVITDLANGMNPLTSEVREQAREMEFLANANNILAKRFGETAASAAEAAEKLQRLNREMAEEKVRAQEMGEKLFGSAEALQKKALATVDAIRQQEKLGRVTEDGAETNRQALAEILEGYARFGAIAPAQVQALADKYGALTAAQARAKASVENLAGAFEGNAKALADRNTKLGEAIAMVEKDGVVTEQAKELIKKAVTEQLDAYTLLGQQAPAALQAIADKYESVSTAQQKLTDKLKGMEEQQRKALDEKLKPQTRDTSGAAPGASAALAEDQKKAEELRATIAALEAQSFLSGEQLAQLFEAKDALAGLRVETEQVAEQAVGVSDAFISAEEAARQLAEAEFGPRLSEQIAETVKKLGELEGAAKSTPVVFDEATQTMTNAAADFTETLITTNEKGEILLTNAEALGQRGGAAVQELASAGGQAATAMGDAATAAEKAAAGVEKLGGSATEVERVGTALSALEPKMRTILDLAEKIKREFAAWDLGGEEAGEAVH